MASTPRPLRFVDGWYTDDPDEFRFYTRDARKLSYRGQLARDVRDWKPWAWWIAALASIAVGALRGDGHLVIVGAVLLAMYAHMIHRVVSGYRNGILVEGVVATFDRRHPLFRSHLAGAFLPDDAAVKETIVAILPEWAVRAHANPDGSLRVLVAHSPGAEYSQVVGIRLAGEARPEAPQATTFTR